MKKTYQIMAWIILLALTLGACAPQAATPNVEPVATVAAAEPLATEALAATEAVQPTEAPAVTEASQPGAAPAGAGGAITVTDALGRTVTFKEAPKRIVVTGKALFMIADALYTFPEAKERVVAMGSTAQTKNSNFVPLLDPDYDKKAVLEGEAGPEQIAAFTPDLVILKSYLAEKLGKPIEELGIPVVYVDLETPEQYVRDLTVFGQIFQNEARAKELIAFYQEKSDMVKKATSSLTDEQKPKVLLLYYSDKDGEIAFNVPPVSWIQTTMPMDAGGKPVWTDANLGKGWSKVSLEQIAAWDADQIFIIAYFQNVSDVIATLKADAQWQSIRAVKDGKIYGFPGDFYSWDQSDVRWILGQMWLAKIIQPDLFKDLDLNAEIMTFYQTLYQFDQAAVEKDVLPILKGDIN